MESHRDGKISAFKSLKMLKFDRWNPKKITGIRGLYDEMKEL